MVDKRGTNLVDRVRLLHVFFLLDVDLHLCPLIYVESTWFDFFNLLLRNFICLFLCVKCQWWFEWVLEFRLLFLRLVFLLEATRIESLGELCRFELILILLLPLLFLFSITTSLFLLILYSKALGEISICEQTLRRLFLLLPCIIFRLKHSRTESKLKRLLLLYLLLTIRQTLTFWKLWNKRSFRRFLIRQIQIQLLRRWLFILFGLKKVLVIILKSIILGGKWLQLREIQSHWFEGILLLLKNVLRVTRHGVSVEAEGLLERWIRDVSFVYSFLQFGLVFRLIRILRGLGRILWILLVYAAMLK